MEVSNSTTDCSEGMVTKLITPRLLLAAILTVTAFVKHNNNTGLDTS